MIKIVTLNTSNDNDVKEMGIRLNNTSLKAFRAELKKRGYTELKTIYRAGKYVVEFITSDIKRIDLIDAGLIRGTKAERAAYEAAKEDSLKNFGYCW